ncbi:MAG: 6-hydroxymethylpterin diphosphokinase MptE-like protein [Candidatus Heimdallarchaeaceae archaeon]
MSYNTKKSKFHSLEKLNFSLESWLNFWYPNICKYLDINPNEDMTALKNITQNYRSSISPTKLSNLLKNRIVYLVAPGYTIEEHEKELIDLVRKSKGKATVISVDGATTIFFKHDIIPDIIVSDLDGNVEHQIYAQKAGSILLVHVHGDNKETLEKYLPEISKMDFMLTTQTRPINTAYNFYGFSDGDRAVSLCKYFNAREAVLIGYDFGDKIGFYSKKTEIESKEFLLRKMKKFVIAQSVINWCENVGLKISKDL